MPFALRSRLALLAFLGIFLIPIGMSSMRGLTHVLTCSEEVETPFTLGLQEEGEPDLGSSLLLEPGQEEETGLCGGLQLDMSARPLDASRVELDLPITNNTEHSWRGTITLQVEDLTVPVDIREIPPGETRSDRLTLDLDPGTHEIGGTLLIGP